ncbi:unnamed protein product [Durusdinium trenchii]|uniref:Pentatricopeptide repeat-containing protein n=2 Tax=Durusdinium trenchii TaxID=1381693 RepID=A0ABP0HB98_9DINO
MDYEDDGDDERDAHENEDDTPFDTGIFNLDEQQYGRAWMLEVRQVMMPIEKPIEVANLKFLICPSAAPDDDADRDRVRGRDRKGKGAQKGQASNAGRFIPEMGRTEIVPRSQRGTWWRNCCRDRGEVIIREQFLLTSEEISRVPYGQYVLQAGPLEVFVTGPAQGLQRMPVQPRGWATVDAQAVGGPLYLEKVKSPKWQVVFSSGSSKGDIVVRKGVSLDSEEVAVLTCGTVVEQASPLEITEDGIVRMPITFEGRQPSSSSHPAKARMGWVTCDATHQGGPKFFEPVDSDAKPKMREQEQDEGNWETNRIWRVANLQDADHLPLVRKCEPYAPGSGKVPPSDMLIRYLENGEMVTQVGHSKKVRGYMVMPVKLDTAGGEQGWVVRRLVDRNRDQAAWFEEMINGEVRDKRKHRRDKDQPADE